MSSRAYSRRTCCEGRFEDTGLMFSVWILGSEREPRVSPRESERLSLTEASVFSAFTGNHRSLSIRKETLSR